MRLSTGARRLGRAAVLGGCLVSCTLTADLDRYKGESVASGGAGGTAGDAAVEKGPCEKGNCSGCDTCETTCLCNASPALYDKCVADCLAAGG